MMYGKFFVFFFYFSNSDSDGEFERFDLKTQLDEFSDHLCNDLNSFLSSRL